MRQLVCVFAQRRRRVRKCTCCSNGRIQLQVRIVRVISGAKDRVAAGNVQHKGRGDVRRRIRSVAVQPIVFQSTLALARTGNRVFKAQRGIVNRKEHGHFLVPVVGGGARVSTHVHGQRRRATHRGPASELPAAMMLSEFETLPMAGSTSMHAAAHAAVHLIINGPIGRGHDADVE